MRLSRFDASPAFQACQHAFLVDPPDGGLLAESLSLVKRNRRYDETEVMLLTSICKFASLLGDLPKRPVENALLGAVERLGAVAAIGEFLQKHILPLANHSVMTHTFVMDHLIRRVQCKTLRMDIFVCFVHDVSCDSDFHFFDKLPFILDCISRDATVSLLSYDICLLQRIIHKQVDAELMPQIMSVLCRQYMTVRDCGSVVPDAFMRWICSVLVLPGFMADVHFQEEFVDHLIHDTCNILKHRGSPNILQSKVPIAEVIRVYMHQGPYFANTVFIRVGKTLEEHPWFPLIDAFVSAVPSYPFPSSTWRRLEADGPPPDDKGRQLTLMNSQTTKQRITMSGARVEIDDLRPGEWHCLGM